MDGATSTATQRACIVLLMKPKAYRAPEQASHVIRHDDVAERRERGGDGRRTQRACALLRPPPRTPPRNVTVTQTRSTHPHMTQSC
eukprot:scaffold2026_cov117-Skeletonema_dohrnii-CCMP3373.AAC.5